MELFTDMQKQAEGLLGGVFTGESDPASGPIEQVSEMADSVLGIGKNLFTGLTTAIGLPSVKKMLDEMQAEYQAADIVCDKLEGAIDIQIPNPFGPSPEVCLSADQLGWAIRPENLMETGKIVLSCGLEEFVTEPVDFVLSLGKIIQSGNYEELSGWFAGLLSGEAVPILHPFQLLTMPAQLAACSQAKIAVKQGKMTQRDLDDMTKDIYKLTGRETGMARNLLKNVGL